ncbi:MAG: ubiquinone/menaquinone biosynthesis methyltransferase [Pseudomonadota bacterium]
MSDLDRSFGYRQVSNDERRDRIRRVFRAVAPRYDLMNDLMSFGIHRLWKALLVRAVGPRPGQTLLDLGGGTGDVGRALSGPDRRVIVCDPSVEMMQAGRARPGNDHLGWLAGEAEAIPLADASIDSLTISFGIRNVTRLDRALAEMHRVLKPGGTAFCLEFSRAHPLLRPFYDLFSFQVIPRLGALIAREPEAYTYLVESIRKFPDQDSFAAQFRDAGFADVRYRNLSFGIACLHIATKAR